MDLKGAIKAAGSGARGAKFPKKGAIVGGPVESAELFQSRDDDGELEFWDDGSVKQKLRIIVQTNLDEGEDDNGREDDGRRAIYIKWWGEQKKAFLAAMKAADLDDLPPGSKFFAKYVGDGEKAKKSWSAPKIMKYKAVSAPVISADEFDDEEDEEPAPRRRAAKPAASTRRRPAPEPEDDEEDEEPEPPKRRAAKPAAAKPRRRPAPEPEDDEDEDFGEDEEPEPPKRRAAKPTASTRRRPAPEPEDDEEDEEPEPPKRRTAKPAAAKPRRRPAPEPEDDEEDDLEGVGDPVDDTADALSAAGLGDDF